MRMNKKGFTLVELVVAIAALALCSGILLTMFITSDDLASDASLYDDSVIWSSNIAEVFRESTDLDIFIKNAHLSNRYLDNDTSQYKWTLYLDDNWYEKDNIEKASIEVDLEIILDSEYLSGELYKIKINIYELRDNEKTAILELIGKKYYQGGVS